MSLPLWRLSHRADAAVVPLADRHYNRQKVGAPQFAPPGRCFVLKRGTTAQLREPWTGGAFWVTSWPFGRYVKHAWPGAWICSAFRKECPGVASEFIRQAVAATRAKWPEVPDLGMVTFIDREQVPPNLRHGKPRPGVAVWGHSYIEAGFEPAGETKGGLLAFQLRPENMPGAAPALGQQTGFAEMAHFAALAAREVSP